MMMSIFLLVLIRPSPEHLWHFFSGNRPLPPHLLQMPTRVKNPNALLDVLRTWPAPLHSSQVIILYPLSMPFPPHPPHESIASNSNVFFAPRSLFLITTSKYKCSPGWFSPLSDVPRNPPPN